MDGEAVVWEFLVARADFYDFDTQPILDLQISFIYDISSGLAQRSLVS